MKINIYTKIKVHPSRTASQYLLVRLEIPTGQDGNKKAKYIYLILFDDQVNFDIM